MLLYQKVEATSEKPAGVLNKGPDCIVFSECMVIGSVVARCPQITEVPMRRQLLLQQWNQALSDHIVTTATSRLSSAVYQLWKRPRATHANAHVTV